MLLQGHKSKLTLGHYATFQVSLPLNEVRDEGSHLDLVMLSQGGDYMLYTEDATKVRQWGYMHVSIKYFGEATVLILFYMCILWGDNVFKLAITRQKNCIAMNPPTGNDANLFVKTSGRRIKWTYNAILWMGWDYRYLTSTCSCQCVDLEKMYMIFQTGDRKYLSNSGFVVLLGDTSLFKQANTLFENVSQYITCMWHTDTLYEVLYSLWLGKS